MTNNIKNLKEIKNFTYKTILETFKEKVCTLQSYRNFVEYDNSYLVRKDECANVVLETNDINIKSNTETELNYDPNNNIGWLVLSCIYIVHELSHLQQDIDKFNLLTDENYRDKIELANEAKTFDILINSGKELKHILDTVNNKYGKVFKETEFEKSTLENVFLMFFKNARPTVGFKEALGTYKTISVGTKMKNLGLVGSDVKDFYKYNNIIFEDKKNNLCTYLAKDGMLVRDFISYYVDNYSDPYAYKTFEVDYDTALVEVVS